MEPFSLLKYWRGPVSVSATHGESSSFISNKIITDGEESGDDDDEGPFFDMEFAVPCSEENREIEVDCDSDGENGKDFEFALSSGSSGSAGEQSDPSDDLFFKGRLVSIDTEVSEQNQKSLFLQKSANRLRILMLKLKKSKCNEGLKTDSTQVQNNNNNNNKESLIISLFTRDGSKSQKQIDRENTPVSDSTTSKDLMQKYLNKVKPMYVHVSRRYAEKLKLGSDKDGSGSAPAVSSESGNVKGQKQGNLQAGLKIVYKHLGKSRSAAAPPPAAVAVTSRRCDDSLLDQQDGIQGAILHCKRSFNSSRDCSSLSTLARSVSDPTPPRKVPEKSL